eukprot:TRINITY_DN128_c2_g1_i1.p1 TRINITY_DN128_c2_g1~~TRINITY_DN128_c2_g1_i1.p1  ORF type:complete len:318 (-),score=137.32 TRINITY_DN128_c2_g1_i1:137-1090(-)
MFSRTISHSKSFNLNTILNSNRNLFLLKNSFSTFSINLNNKNGYFKNEKFIKYPNVTSTNFQTLSSRNFTTSALSNADLLNLMKREEFIKIRKTIEQDERFKMKYSEFEQLCKDHNLTNEDIKLILTSFNNSGIVLHFPNSTDSEFKEYICLKPQQISNKLYEIFDLDGSRATQLITKINQNLQVYESELEKLLLVKDKIDCRAIRFANICIWLCGFYLFAQTAILARMTWWEFSWDIVEPITYFVTFSATLVAYMYFVTTSAEYTFENLRDRLARRYRENRYPKVGIDLDRIQFLEGEISILKKQLKENQNFLANL